MLQKKEKLLKAFAESIESREKFYIWSTYELTIEVNKRSGHWKIMNNSVKKLMKMQRTHKIFHNVNESGYANYIILLKRKRLRFI